MNLLQDAFRDITTLGGFVFTGLLCLILLATEQYELLFQTVLGLFLILVICIIIRLIYYKDRPLKQKHQNIIERIDASSFPSMHTARAIFLPIIFWNHLNNPLLQGLVVILALTVSYSRIYLQKHDWIDLLGGAVLGGIIGIAVVYI
ncbi:phosphatase PAP2 family protein [Candidatus Woesearchaeota archaeon]|nr:phosphatase PAP2 family protein [Candidatus Woesearchaeota archaeon]